MLRNRTRPSTVAIHQVVNQLLARSNLSLRRRLLSIIRNSGSTSCSKQFSDLIFYLIRQQLARNSAVIASATGAYCASSSTNARRNGLNPKAQTGKLTLTKLLGVAVSSNTPGVRSANPSITCSRGLVCLGSIPDGALHRPPTGPNLLPALAQNVCDFCAKSSEQQSTYCCVKWVVRFGDASTQRSSSKNRKCRLKRRIISTSLVLQSFWHHNQNALSDQSSTC